MPEFLGSEERKASDAGFFKIARIKDDKEQVDLEVRGIGTALDIVKAYTIEVGRFRVYDYIGNICHSGY